jgi:hypothetical protein
MRPRKQDDEKRIHPIAFRLTNPEKAILDAQAGRAGVVANEMARIFTTRSEADVSHANPGRFDPAMIKRLEQVGMDLKTLLNSPLNDPAVIQQIKAALEEIKNISRIAVEESISE